MCQYSSDDGTANDWHLVHLGSRAVGGPALVMVEATAVVPEGRISPEDMGIWAEKHIEPLARIATFVAAQNSIPAIQLAHAGRKASTERPWAGNKPVQGERAWQPVAPSPVPFDDASPTPRELTEQEIESLVNEFVEATKRALRAGFKLIEIHAAHGYLLHEFLSPISNQRQDQFGGSLENRMRFPLMVAEAVRKTMPDDMPLFTRISATDYAESGGWDLDQSIELSRRLKALGVDLIDCSSGGSLPHAKINLVPGYQVPFAEAIKRDAAILTGAVGLITEAEQANAIIDSGQADIVLLARQLLRDPYWPLHAARQLGVDVPWPPQYGRAARK
jgi:2,4-dienoyl-CoA reductase-like NADH-dependent reductase (Old Yellow Enzyme family)